MLYDVYIQYTKAVTCPVTASSFEEAIEKAKDMIDEKDKEVLVGVVERKSKREADALDESIFGKERDNE